MSKLKKFLLLIPTAFIMLLNCMSFTAFADEINYQDYWIDLSEIPELQSREWIFDSTKDSDNPGFSKYIYAVDTINKASYDEFISGENSTFSFCSYYLDLTNIEFDSNDYSVISLNKVPIQSIEFEFRDGKVHSYVAVTKSYFIRYFLDSGTIQMNDSSSFSGYSLVDESYIDTSKYYIHIESNHPDFPVPDFAGGSDVLNVSVNFDPEMSGDFQRREIINDKIVTIDTLNFSVTNNSKFSIQYLVAIVGQNDEFYIAPENLGFSHPNGRTYSGNPSYVYVSDEWIYLPSGSSKQSITSTYAPSSWHYVDEGDTDTVTVRFNQMKLDIGVIYNVYVYAIKNTNDGVCVIGTNHDSWQYNQDYVLNFAEAQVVYNSEFTCSNPAEFDSNSNDGSYAYDGDTSLFNRANGYIDENGNVVIDRIDTDSLISGSDSWGSKYDSNAWDVYYSKQNSVSSDLNQLSNNFSSFFRFVNKIFGYFPKNYQSVISLGLTSVVVLGIIKVVIK